jgi:hypothetical protein
MSAKGKINFHGRQRTIPRRSSSKNWKRREKLRTELKRMKIS